MTEDPISFLLTLVAAFIVIKWAMRLMGSSEDDQVDVQVIFPVDLKYNEYQWYGWDHDGEFLGQASTKDLLMDQISKEIDLPLEKFKIMSEQKIIQPAK